MFEASSTYCVCLSVSVSPSLIVCVFSRSSVSRWLPSTPAGNFVEVLQESWEERALLRSMERKRAEENEKERLIQWEADREREKEKDRARRTQLERERERELASMRLLEMKRARDVLENERKAREREREWVFKKHAVLSKTEAYEPCDHPIQDGMLRSL